MYGKTLKVDRFFPIFYIFAQNINFSMKYLVADFKIKCNEELFETACALMADAAGEAGFESFEDCDNGIKGYVQKDLFDKLLLDSSIKDFPLEDVSIDYTLEDVENKDWNETWENAGFDPIVVDNRIIIYDAKHTADDELETFKSVLLDKNANDTKTIIPVAIEAKLAFGTGSHQTTRMIVSVLSKMELAGKRVLDCGCGTGILGITSLKLGANSAVGYDIDEWSVENTKHNAEINSVSNITAYHGDCKVLNNIDEKFDVVLANINRNILLNDMDSFKSVMKDNAVLIISGFYEEDAPYLLSKASELNLHEKERHIDENWTCLVLQ